MTMSRDGISVWANQVIHDARRNPEWQQANLLAEDGDQDALEVMAQVFERETQRLIDTYPACDREALTVAVNEKMARRCGLI